MPIYDYRQTGSSGCTHCRAGFEKLQRLDDAPLDACPRCGAPVERQVTAPYLGTSSPSLGDANVGKHGFTKYRRAEKGVYEKTAGTGPDVIGDKKS